MKSIAVYFTLDTICPFTYLGRRAFQLACKQVAEDQPDYAFRIQYMPYLIARHLDIPKNDASPAEDEVDPEEAKAMDKRAWYLEKCNGNEETLKKMEEAMLDMSSKLGIRIVYTGVVANSLPAHRLIQHLQQKREIDEEEYSYDKIEKFMDHLYQSYFTHSQHPSSVKTLASCIKEAGLPMSRDQVAAFLASDKLARETKAMVAEQEVNDVTGVPDVRIDGRRRDITLVGAKFVEEYAAALRQIIKEFN